MKAMYTAFLITAVIAIAAPYVLDEMGFSAGERNSGNAVRLGDG